MRLLGRRFGGKFFYLGSISIFLLFLLYGCSGEENMSIFNPASNVGEMQLDLVKTSFFVMLGVFAVVMSLYFYVLIRFRYRPGRSAPKTIFKKDDNVKLEILWTTIPIFILVFLAVPTVKNTFLMDERVHSPDKVVVNVVANKFWWSFEYPDYGIRTSQELHLPVNAPVELRLKSTDVMHSFWVVHLGGKKDLVPGVDNVLTLTPNRTGEFAGRCAEHCGSGHALMNFKVYVHESDEFKKWLKNMNDADVVSKQLDKDSGDVKGSDVNLFNKNCALCHNGNNAPDMTNFCARSTIAGRDIKGILNGSIKINGLTDAQKHSLTKKDLFFYLLENPVSFKPGILMPKFNQLNVDEKEKLWKYLTNFCQKTGLDNFKE